MITSKSEMKLLGHRIEIQGCDPSMWTDTGMGRSSIGTCKILIKSTMPCDAFNSTLLHEILHMIADHSALNITEQQNSALAAGLYSVMRDNPIMFQNISNGLIGTASLLKP
jgi:hypothetical protein